MAITYSDVRNPVWADPQQTWILCEVNWDNISWEDWSPCTVMASGDEPYIHEIYNRCVAGDFGAIGSYVRPSNMPNDEALTWLIRNKRDQLLQETDVIMAADRFAAMTTEKQQEWTNYRQALRDMPSQTEYQSMEGVFNETTYEFDPSVTINWPTKPS